MLTYSQSSARQKLLSWVLPTLSAALFLGVVESIFTVAFFPAAASDGPGFLRFFLEIVVLFWTLSLLISVPCALFIEPLIKRNPPSTPAILSIFLGVITASLVFFILLEPFSKGQHLQFPKRLELVHQFVVFAAMAISAFVFPFIVYPLLTRLSKHSPNLFRPRVLSVLVGLPLVVFIHWTVAFGLFAIHLDVLIVPTGLVAALVCVFVFRQIVPQKSNRLSKILLGVFTLLLCLATTVPWRVDHSRFVLHRHAPMAGSFADLSRDLLDFDGDGACSTWVGGADCAAFDSSRGPFEREIPGDGIDQNCTGVDGRTDSSQKKASNFSLEKCNRAMTPNSVIIITIDALRGDILNNRITPNILSFGKQSTFFTRAYSPSTFTAYSLAAFFNGSYFSDIASSNFFLDRSICIGESFQRSMQKTGYKTAQINYIGTAEWLHDGFDTVNPTTNPKDPFNGSVFDNFVSAKITDDAMDYLQRNAGKSVFLWMHYSDLHAPYGNPKDSKFDKGDVLPYERTLAYVDHQVGRLLRYISKTPLAASSYIVVTSDHGEDLGARGKEGHGPNPFEETTRVPLLLRVPGCGPKIVNTPTSLTAVAPSLGALAGVPIFGETFSMDSKEDTPVVVEAIYAEGAYSTMKAARAFIIGEYKLVVDLRNGGRMLFNIGEDSKETENLYYLKPKVSKRLEARYQAWQDRPRPKHLDNCSRTGMDPHGTLRIDQISR